MSVELDEVYGFLAQHEPFSTLPEDTLCALPAQMGITYVRRGQAVVEVGQPNDTLFVIRSGAVDIVSADNLLLDRREAFLELLEQFPDMGRFFQTASRRVRAAAEEVRDGGATEVLRTPLRRIFAGREPVTRDKHVSIAEAARTMGDEGISSLIITDGQEVAGIIADADMRSRVVAAGVDTSRPVADVMTSPVRTITPNALVFEAMLTMSELGIHHLPVASDTQVVGVVTAADIMHQLQADPIYLAADVAQASQQELEGAYRDAARVAVRLFERGASAAETQRLLTSIADAVAKRLGTLAVEKLGPAGVRGVGAGQRPGDRPRRRRILCSARGGRGGVRHVARGDRRRGDVAGPRACRGAGGVSGCARRAEAARAFRADGNRVFRQTAQDVRGSKWRLHDSEVVDTFAMERRHMERMGTYPRGEDLRLPRVRQRYNLPMYANHNALTDAVACAELYLALTASG
ncbi:CBS domain-containing protein [Corynebacterium afermentans]|uniref:CBS domain-containing protein n=1 Tax=Corynebacterium afermentans TaxID=38286 RepID=UPI0025737ED2|nr:CBS domain-containing protein [Corynebacterium afermentans]